MNQRTKEQMINTFQTSFISYAYLEKLFGLSRGLARYHLTKWGYDLKERNEEMFVEKVFPLLKSGYSVESVANKYGVSIQFIYNFCKEYGFYDYGRRKFDDEMLEDLIEFYSVNTCANTQKEFDICFITLKSKLINYFETDEELEEFEEFRLSNLREVRTANHSKVIELYKSGVGTKEISERLYISVTSIYDILRDNNIKRHGSKKPLDINQIKEYYINQDLSLKEIGDLLKVSQPTVARYLRDAGVQIKEKKRKKRKW